MVQTHLDMRTISLPSQCLLLDHIRMTLCSPIALGLNQGQGTAWGSSPFSSSVKLWWGGHVYPVCFLHHAYTMLMHGWAISQALPFLILLGDPTLTGAFASWPFLLTGEIPIDLFHLSQARFSVPALRGEREGSGATFCSLSLVSIFSCLWVSEPRGISPQVWWYLLLSGVQKPQFQKPRQEQQSSSSARKVEEPFCTPLWPVQEKRGLLKVNPLLRYHKWGDACHAVRQSG